MNGTAEDYDKLCPKFLPRYVESAIDSHFSAMEWSEEDVILDIGCGPGRTTKSILLPKCPKLKKIVAVDIIPDYIEYAKKTYFDEKIEFKVQDIIQRPDIKEIGKYDKVVSFYAFHFINDYQKLFSVISSILKPGGYFFFIYFTKWPLIPILQNLSTNEEWKKYIKTENMLNTIPLMDNWNDVESEFKNFLSKFDFRVTKSKCEVLDISYSNKKHYLDILVAVLPKALFQKMEPDVKNRLLKQAEQIILKFCSQKENGEISAPLNFCRFQE
ncbi:juvenile hormone acid O-methyltransferase-like [Centruroides sculpturatus]|uniref:juvenile hormone acid O-methyltransferase-like n=1 Tax=Centruroides sculpturatus TaxID=218467 RepID=UPI000C6CEF59|nr:juvenile hormone acid O-methyltransferase-like [Centruroides sculpturatus]